MAKANSVKSMCEEGILAGKSPKVLMNHLTKNTDKEEAVLEKSIKYYASALHREGKIDDDAKAIYVGKSGRGRTAAAVSKEDSSVAKKPRKSKTRDADDADVTDAAPKKSRKSKVKNNDAADGTTPKKSRKTKSPADDDVTPPAKKARAKKSKVQS